MADEPLFAESVQPQAEVHEQPVAEVRQPVVNTSSSDWDREQRRLHEMNVAAVFGGEADDEEDDEDKTDSGLYEVDGNRADVSAHPEPPAPVASGNLSGTLSSTLSGTLEEEEIEEEEADLSHYVEDLEEDASFEELEEETHAAGEHEHHEQPIQEIAASAEFDQRRSSPILR